MFAVSGWQLRINYFCFLGRVYRVKAEGFVLLVTRHHCLFLKALPMQLLHQGKLNIQYLGPKLGFPSVFFFTTFGL